MSKRRKYSPEFKQSVVPQLRHSNVFFAQVARELGIEPNVLSRWSREAQLQEEARVKKERLLGEIKHIQADSQSALGAARMLLELSDKVN